MGLTYETFKLVNDNDVAEVRMGRRSADSLQATPVKFLVDTGSNSTFITEEIAKELNLTITNRERPIRVGGGKGIVCRETSPVEVLWKDRYTYIVPLIMPGQTEPIMGVVALEAMDLIVDPTINQVVGAHGDQPVFQCI
jgi:predicted aspartyl protease